MWFYKVIYGKSFHCLHCMHLAHKGISRLKWQDFWLSNFSRESCRYIIFVPTANIHSHRLCLSVHTTHYTSRLFAITELTPGFSPASLLFFFWQKKVKLLSLVKFFFLLPFSFHIYSFSVNPFHSFTFFFMILSPSFEKERKNLSICSKSRKWVSNTYLWACGTTKAEVNAKNYFLSLFSFPSV